MAEIILSVADTSLLAAMITLIVAGITFKLAVVTSSVVKIPFVVA